MGRIHDSHSRLSGSALQSRVSQFGRRSFIKSIQRGTITLNNVTSNTATITAVDPNNTVLHCLGFTDASFSKDSSAAQMSLVLTNSTTITAAITTAEAVDHIISYEVVEMWPGVVKSIQRGTVSCVNSGSATATITAINVNKSQLIGGGFKATTTLFQENAVFGRLDLTNATTVTFTQPGFDGTFTVPFQVVEYY